jgi:riboflavin kinase/FMN adenylyltransferase
VQVTRLQDVASRPRRVAMGQFDGVHVGHRAVIDGCDTVLTFEPHPLAVIYPDAAPKLLTTLPTKIELIAELGVRELVVIEFDEAFARQSAVQFIDEVLLARLQATDVSMGENFRFGHRAAGTPEMLVDDPRFRTRIVRLVEADGEIVSSSHIRALITAGEVAHAGRFLGRPFQLRGEVVHGDKRGRDLGYPTANLIPADGLVCPGHGVYAARVGDVAAAVNVGVRPTFGMGLALLVEAYLLDWEGDLYGSEMRLDFLTRLRGERRFDSAQELIDQMALDVQQTRELAGADR